MIFIIDKKKYDTEKSEKIISYLTSCEEYMLGYKYFARLATTLYRTKKGNWFSVREQRSKFIATKENEDNVKKLFIDLNAVEEYNKYFEEIEEA